MDVYSLMKALEHILMRIRHIPSQECLNQKGQFKPQVCDFQRVITIFDAKLTFGLNMSLFKEFR